MLFEAAGGKGDLVVVKVLVGQYGRQAFNARDRDDNQAPIHRAAHFGRVDIIRFLLGEADGDKECLDGQGRTPLHVAMERGRLPAVQCLIEEFHVAIDPLDKDGRTPLDAGVWSSQLDVVRYLIGVKESMAVEAVKDFAARLLACQPEEIRRRYQEEAKAMVDEEFQALEGHVHALEA